MRVFKDKEGREWEIHLTIAAVKRVRDLLNVNLCELESGNPPLLTRLGTDEIFICDVLYCLCRNQAESRGVTEDGFGELLCGDVIMAATEAMYAELVDFFQKRGRTDRVKALTAQLEVIRLAVARVTVEIDALDIEKKIDQAFGKTSINLPEPSESIPTP